MPGVSKKVKNEPYSPTKGVHKADPQVASPPFLRRRANRGNEWAMREYRKVALSPTSTATFRALREGCRKLNVGGRNVWEEASGLPNVLAASQMTHNSFIDPRPTCSGDYRGDESPAVVYASLAEPEKPYESFDPARLMSQEGAPNLTPEEREYANGCITHHAYCRKSADEASRGFVGVFAAALNRECYNLVHVVRPELVD